MKKSFVEENNESTKLWENAKEYFFFEDQNQRNLRVPLSRCSFGIKRQIPKICIQLASPSKPYTTFFHQPAVEKRQSQAAMAKDGTSNMTCEDFEPFCQWKRLQDSDILEVHLQDFKKEELRVRVSNNSVLILSGERLTSDNAKKIKFEREIKLSKEISTDQIRAKFGGGVLSITMPKKALAAPKPEEPTKPKVEANDSAVESAEKNISKLEKLIRSSLCRLKFNTKTAAATVVVAAAIVALGAHYLTQN